MKELKFFRIYKENPAKEQSKVFLIIENLRIELHDLRTHNLFLEEKLQILNFITKNDINNERRTFILKDTVKRVNDDAYIFNKWLDNIIWEGHTR